MSTKWATVLLILLAMKSRLAIKLFVVFPFPFFFFLKTVRLFYQSNPYKEWQRQGIRLEIGAEISDRVSGEQWGQDVNHRMMNLTSSLFP